MKLIMENWRKFVEDDGVLSIDILQTMNNNLLEVIYEDLEDDNEQIQNQMSVEDIKKTSAEEIMQDFKQLSKNRRLIQGITKGEVSKSKEKITNMLKDEENYVIFDSLENFAERLASNMKGELPENAKEIVFKKLDQTMTPLQKEIIIAIFLFTGANVSAVRDPEKFDQDSAEINKFINDLVLLYFKPSKSSYIKANIIIKKLLQSQYRQSKPLFRGLAVSVEKGSKFASIDKYIEGAIVPLGEIVSFSTSTNTAGSFAYQETQKQPGTLPVLLIFPPKEVKQAFSVGGLSQYADEDEVIVSGKAKIDKVMMANLSIVGMGPMSAIQELRRAGGSYSSPDRAINLDEKMKAVVQNPELNYDGDKILIMMLNFIN